MHCMYNNVCMYACICIGMCVCIVCIILCVQVIWKYHFSEKSASEHGTLYQLRNLIGRSNVVTKPKKDMNACEGFFILIWRSYVTTAATKVLGISSIDEWPSHIPKDVRLQDKDKCQKGMYLILSKIIDDFVHVSFNSPRPRPCPTNDKVFSYAVQLLSIGCLHAEFADAIREGDGERVIRCWRCLMSYSITQIEIITPKKLFYCYISTNMFSRLIKHQSYYIADLSIPLVFQVGIFQPIIIWNT